MRQKTDLIRNGRGIEGEQETTCVGYVIFFTRLETPSFRQRLRSRYLDSCEPYGLTADADSALSYDLNHYLVELSEVAALVNCKDDKQPAAVVD